TQNTNRINTTAAMTGWYKMLVNLNGCSFIDSTYATVHPIPAVPNISYTNPLCVGETLSLGTTTVSGASYSWSGPGSFSSSSQNPSRSNMQFGDTGTYKLTTTVNGCTSDTGTASVHINPLPFVVILANPADSICQGDRVNFTALPNNHGGTPAYQWYVNGQASGMGTVFSTTALNDQDVVRCDMTENTKCSAPYTDPSNDITMNVLPWLGPTVSISVSPNRPLKENEYATFTAIATNAGNNPQYQWKRNGQDIVGATGSVWSANTLNDNDSISVEVISSYKCPQPSGALSNGIVVKVLTGMAGLSEVSGLMLYPNPNNGNFVLKGEALTSDVLKIEIINAMGQVVYRGEVVTENGRLHKEINVPDISSGIYLLKLQGRESTSTLRFTVQ
ncbi:MAG TPA: T9SS type A sorting domain-containing protein, partial [Flavipsychrobacter sp.]